MVIQIRVPNCCPLTQTVNLCMTLNTLQTFENRDGYFYVSTRLRLRDTQIAGKILFLGVSVSACSGRDEQLN